MDIFRFSKVKIVRDYYKPWMMKKKKKRSQYKYVGEAYQQYKLDQYVWPDSK